MLFIHLGKVASADTVFEIGSHSHLVEVSGGVFNAFLGSHVWHLVMGDWKNFASDVVSFMGCFIGNIWTVSTVILPSFRKKSIDENPTGVVWVLADDVKERICSCGFSEGIVPLSFEVLRELEGANIMGSRGLVREWVVIVGGGVRDRKVIIRGYLLCRWSITSVDNSVEDRVSIFPGEGRRDCPSILKSALGMVRGDKA